MAEREGLFGGKAASSFAIAQDRSQARVAWAVGPAPNPRLGFEPNIADIKKGRQKAPVFNGGERGIRTLGTLARTTVFETAPFDRSGTSPHCLAHHMLAGRTARTLPQAFCGVNGSILWLHSFFPAIKQAHIRPLKFAPMKC